MQGLGAGISFAPLGLIYMFNVGGAIYNLEYQIHQDLDFCEENEVLGMPTNPSESGQIRTATVKMTVHGCGRFGAYSSARPRKCLIESSACDFNYDPKSGLLTLVLETPTEGQLWNVTVEV